MQKNEQPMLDELQYYFVVKQTMPDNSTQVTLSSYPPLETIKQHSPLTQKKIQLSIF